MVWNSTTQHTSCFARLLARPPIGTQLLLFSAFGSCEERKEIWRCKIAYAFSHKLNHFSICCGPSYAFPFKSYLLKLTFECLKLLLGLFWVCILTCSNNSLDLLSFWLRQTPSWFYVQCNRFIKKLKKDYIIILKWESYIFNNCFAELLFLSISMFVETNNYNVFL